MLYFFIVLAPLFDIIRESVFFFVYVLFVRKPYIIL